MIGEAISETDVLSAIYTFANTHGHVPAARDIQHSLGRGSASIIWSRLNRLEKSGLIRRDPRRRSYAVVMPSGAHKCPCCQQYVKREKSE